MRFLLLLIVSSSLGRYGSDYRRVGARALAKNEEIIVYRLCLLPFWITDDITMTADGVDTYQIVKDAKRYK